MCSSTHHGHWMDAVNEFFSIKPNIQQHIDMPWIFNMYNDFLSHAHSV